MAGDHYLTNKGANQPAFLANLKNLATCILIHNSPFSFTSYSSCCKLTVKDVVTHLISRVLQHSALSPSFLQCTHTGTCTHHRRMSHLTNSHCHKALISPIHSIYYYDTPTMCQAQNTELGIQRQVSQAQSTLLCYGTYSLGQ